MKSSLGIRASRGPVERRGSASAGRPDAIVPDSLTFVGGQLRNGLREAANRGFDARTAVEERRGTTAFGGEREGAGRIIGVEELTPRPAGSPELNLLLAPLSCENVLVDHCRDHMRVLQADVASRTTSWPATVTLPASWTTVVAKDPDQGALPSTVRAEQRHHLAGLDVQADTVERLDGAEALPDPANLDAFHSVGCYASPEAPFAAGATRSQRGERRQKTVEAAGGSVAVITVLRHGSAP